MLARGEKLSVWRNLIESSIGFKSLKIVTSLKRKRPSIVKIANLKSGQNKRLETTIVNVTNFIFFKICFLRWTNKIRRINGTKSRWPVKVYMAAKKERADNRI